MGLGKKMFITDLDGTLFNDERLINGKDLKALEYLGERGVIRVFATGRSIYSFRKAVEGMGFSPTCSDMPVDYVIFSTGAGIMECTHGAIIKKESLGPKDLNTISDCFDSFKLDYMIHKPVPDTRNFIYKIGNRQTSTGDGDNQGERSENPDFYARIELYRDFSSPMGKNGTAGFGEATEILAIVPPAHGHSMAKKVAEILKNFSVIKATSPLDGESVWIEVFHPHVSKSQATSWLTGKLGILQRDVISVGNDYNDLDLLSWSGCGFVVANAPDDVRMGFKTVASNNQCGVAEVIHKWMDHVCIA